MEEDRIIWEALEFEYHERSQDWYWILGIIVVIGALIAVLLSNFLFGTFIVLAGLMLGMLTNKYPNTIHCSITRKGIQVDTTIYLFSSINSFWVDETNDRKPKLLLTLNQTFTLQIVIPIEDIDTEEIRDYLDQYVQEKPQNEGFVERLLEVLKI